jgi:outer membrane protein assembly factor BamB
MKRWQVCLAFPVTALALGGCASVVDRAQSLWPFGGNQQEGPAEPQDGRISIVALEQKLEADPTTAALPVTIPAESAMTDWPVAGGNLDNAPGARAWTATLETAWRRRAGDADPDRTPFVAPPIVAGGVLYFLDARHTVRALHAASGAERWSVSVRPAETRERDPLLGGLAVAGQRLVATTGYGEIVSLDATNGAVEWRTRVAAPLHVPPSVTGDRVFAVTSDSELVALDAASGRVLWSDQAIAEPARILSSPMIAVSGDTLVAPFASGEVIAFLAANGRRLWSDALTRVGRLTSLSAINDIAGKPVLADGVAYAVSHSGVLAAIDVRTGDRIWQRTAASIQTPLVAGNQLYLVTVDSELVAFDRATGGIHWVRQLPRFRDEADREGRIAWTGPIMAGGRLVLASSEGRVLTVDPTTGEPGASSELGQAVFVPPIAAGGLVYVLGADGTLFALR